MDAVTNLPPVVSAREWEAARDELLTVPLGGTAVGTGINAHPEYAARACARLTELLTLPVREAPNHFHAQATLDVAIAAHGAIRTTAACRVSHCPSPCRNAMPTAFTTAS